MDIITVTKENIYQEHICCAISDKKVKTVFLQKKEWLKERFDDGLVFKKLNIRGKVFIEYMPAEKAWCPLEADRYMHINCFWVSGQFKGKGFSNQLLADCIEDAKAKGKIGLTIVSSEKKRSYLPDPDHLKYKGFLAADTAKPFFVLYYLPFESDALIPKFKECAKQGKINAPGMVLYYTNQCPHTDKYTPIIQATAQKRGQSITICKIETTQQAQNAPTPFTTYSFFNSGEFIANEIFSEKKFENFLDENEY